MNHALLYIEDDEQNVALVEAVLRRRPQVELHVAMNGRDGVRAAIDLRPALILLDNRLPDTTGSEGHSRRENAPYVGQRKVWRYRAPDLTRPANRRHASGGNASFGPSGSFESRTATTSGLPSATSMQLPPLLLRVLFRHTARDRSKSIAVIPHLSRSVNR